MTQKLEKFANLARTTLAADISSGATSLTVASSATFPSTGQFRVAIDNEIFLVSNVSGATWTVTPGYEGTTQLGHTAGADVTLVLSAGIMQAVYPTGRQVTAPGDVSMVTNDFIVEMNKGTPATTTVHLPTDPVLFKTYRVIDLAGNSATYPITVTNDGAFTDTIDSDGTSSDYYFNGTSWNAIHSVAPVDLSGTVPDSRTVNGHPLSSDVTLDAGDVGAPSGSGTSSGTNTGDQDLSGRVPTSRQVNGKALSGDITLTPGDIGGTLRIITAAGDVTMTGTDVIVEINKTTPAATTVNLPASPIIGLVQTVKDGGFNSSAYPITLVPHSGNIDGQDTFTIQLDGAALSFYWNGSNTRIV